MNNRESRSRDGGSRDGGSREGGSRDGGSRDGGSREGGPSKLVIDFKDTKTLKRYLSEDGKILPRRRSGLSAKHQRAVTTAIKRARHLALLPYASRD